ncbi:ATPase H(+)-transporting accessory protein 2 [Aricia agestis]|uniref:ATPase H(+)-transporting accessory protein 2 n=1 Tax=Aricia agestis TaxID=91739 RepID=UPI001C203DC9|nr:ATPase H(+)-transporting accessory protein 2 [Aricia agestis]
MTVSYSVSFTMGVKMALFWITIVISIIGSHAAGELSILHSPQSLKFSGSSEVPESLLKEVFSASLGLSVEENSDWNGLSLVDPFNTPEAVVEVHVDGITSLGENNGMKAKNYPLVVDEYVPDTYEALEHRINQRFNNRGNKLVNAKLSDPEDLISLSSVFGEIVPPKVSKQSLQHLKLDSYEEDYLFLYELEVLKSITAKVKSGVLNADNVIDFYYFKFTSLHALSDYHGPNSLQTKEAKKLLSEALRDLSKAFSKAYDGSVLFTVVTTDFVHTRRTVRAAPRDVMEDIQNDNYSADYSAIFNIILWFGVIFTFALVAIVYAIMDMDPGRDSIIYRMTNTRMKKDN